jgi:hypothetical protein
MPAKLIRKNSTVMLMLSLLVSVLLVLLWFYSLVGIVILSNHWIKVHLLLHVFRSFDLIYLLFLAVVVVSVCKRLKDLVTLLEAPIRGVAPMFTALRKLQVSTEHLTPRHAKFLMLCLLAKCYKTSLSILDDDVFEVDHPRDLYLYCYYGCVAFFFSFELEKREMWDLFIYFSIAF